MQNRIELVRRWFLSKYHRSNIDLEDFLGYVALRFLEGRSQKSPYRYLLADYVKTKNGDKEIYLRMTAKEMERFESKGCLNERGDKIREELRVRLGLGQISQKQHIMSYLVLIHGYTVSEVADIFGLRHKAMSGILKNTLACLENC